MRSSQYLKTGDSEVLCRRQLGIQETLNGRCPPAPTYELQALVKARLKRRQSIIIKVKACVKLCCTLRNIKSDIFRHTFGLIRMYSRISEQEIETECISMTNNPKGNSKRRATFRLIKQTLKDKEKHHFKLIQPIGKMLG